MFEYCSLENNMRCLFFKLVTVLVLINPVFAYASDADIFQWHTSNVQLLRGFDYELGSEQMTIMTLEHANGWKYGDFFIFFDQMYPDTRDQTYYTEATLRLSLSKLSGHDFSYGMIKDVLLTGQMEKPKGQDVRHLAGIAVDLNAPGFKFLKTNFLFRDDPSLAGSTYQLTLIWNRPFEVNGLKFLAEGFADFAGSEGRSAANQLIVPRFLMDLSSVSAIESNQLWMGVEWQYWHNKFGVNGVTESVPQLQVKYVF